MADNNHSEFSEQQTQQLQDIARNGAADEYGYGDNAQANGFEELDPATLLQSLADFEHAASSSELPTVSEAPATSERHFESLLQAVATADGEEAAQASRGHNKPDATRSIISNQIHSPKSTPKSKATTTRTKRKRRQVGDDDDDESVGFIVTASYKRQKKKKAQDEEAEALAREREIWGPECGEEADEDRAAERQTPIGTADARALGVHSAAALFRRPSAASKKYTRPPMAKVYTSLELNAEQFLQLQAAAKKYMLDDDFPERSDCVGNRGKGDTDMTKLKLFGCVESFLEDEGWGIRCWGPSAPGAETRKLKWPELKHKVISLVTPLLRRMVTNERQRIYASESRKGNPQATTKRIPGAKMIQSQGSPTPTEGTPRPNGEQRLSAPSPSPYPVVIDPKLNQYHYNVNESSNAQKFSLSQTQTIKVDPANGGLSTGADDGNTKYLVNIMRDRRRIKPEVALTPTSCPDFFSLVKHVDTIIEDKNLKFTNIKVLGPGVWIDVGNEDTWESAIAVVGENEFMDGVVKCVVEVEEVGQ